MQKCFQCVRPDKNLCEMLLQHNARPHTSNTTREARTQLGWTKLWHPSNSPGLAPSDFHLFRPLKDAVRGGKLSRMMMGLASSKHGCLQDRHTCPHSMMAQSYRTAWRLCRKLGYINYCSINIMHYFQDS
jgi:hypothetical protein